MVVNNCSSLRIIRGCRIVFNATAFYLTELPKIYLSRHPEPCLFIRLTKDAAPKHNQTIKSAGRLPLDSS